MLLGALEAGGTKMVCAIGDENGNVFERQSFPTRTPEETMPDLINYFKDKGIEALGIGSFGPLNLDPNDPNYGVSNQNTIRSLWRRLTGEDLKY